jgi:LPXTG-site transpeptidase (sortase) family protein
MNTNSTKLFSWKLAVIVCLCVGLLAFGLSAAVQSRVFAFLPGNDPSMALIQGSGSTFVAPELPSRLRIPAIGVDAHIQSVGLAWQGTGDMGIPTNFTDVAWYKDGPRPGAPGRAVIDGHLDGKDVPRAVFYDLDKLKKGDLVEVEDKTGKVFQFRVVKVASYDYDAPTEEVFSAEASSARLNLITCSGGWLKSEGVYEKRVVVFTELVAAQ